jgi:phosphoribosylformimino-5-aminoimidazole carboxamide ribotide isomerase
VRIIPVLDLKGGTVVRAEMGRRDRYQPIVTPLSDSSDPVSVASGLRRLFPFPTFYIADLDAIEAGTPNVDAVSRLHGMPDRPELWLDAGFSDTEMLAAALAKPSLRPVLGSESQQDGRLLGRYRDHPNIILSLDFFGDEFRGPKSLLDEPENWPQSVIVMTLAKVGSAGGPDFARLQQIRDKASNRSVIAAGGVRNETDIRELTRIGVTAALVATSLHNGTLAPAQLAALSS